jgi:dihydroflavonol-4-reductase
VGLVQKSSELSRLEGCKVELVCRALCDVEALKTAMAGVDIVFHVAAYAAVGD